MKISRSTPALALAGLLLVFTSGPADAQLFSSGSSGNNGVFNPPANILIDLGAAVASDDGDRDLGTGVFDAENFAIVFHYQEISIPAGVTVTFKNHPKNPPCIWLSQGDVIINGRVDLSGKPGGEVHGTDTSAAPGGAAGPGGFPGGSGQPNGWPGAEDGMGPGGGKAGSSLLFSNGTTDSGVVGHGTLRMRDWSVQRPANGAPYGSDLLVPFNCGGSGGGGAVGLGRGGGGGGGALMIASNSMIALNTGGVLRSMGGFSEAAGVGSAGCFRLVAPVVKGNGSIEARPRGPAGGVGIIRVDAIFKKGIAFTLPDDPHFSIGANMIVFPAVVPKVAVTKIGGVPTAGSDLVIYDTTGDSPGLAPDIEVSVSNFPAGTTAYLTVRVTPEFERHQNHDLDITVDASGAGTGTVTDATMAAGQLNRIDVWTRTPPTTP